MAQQINKQNQLRIINIYKETIADGFGLRYSIYFAGCAHGCAQCHNPESWNENAGLLLTDEWFEQIVAEVNGNPLLDGITLSGGDPLFFPESMHEFLIELKARTQLNIWCYTGFTYEELVADTMGKICLRYIDVLVDGRFEIELFNPHLHFRGSSNQRIIHLKDGNIDYTEE